MQRDGTDGQKGSGAVIRFTPGPQCRLEVDLTETLRLIRVLAGFRCSWAEVAVGLDVSESTLDRFKRRWPEAGEAYEAGLLTCTASLRRKQFEVAMRGNTAMLIWLGKQLLGQRDKLDVRPDCPTHEEELDELDKLE